MTENPEYLWSYVENLVKDVVINPPAYMTLFVHKGVLQLRALNNDDGPFVYVASVTHGDIKQGFSRRTKATIIDRLRELQREGQLQCQQ